LVNVSRAETSLTADTIAQLVATTLTQANKSEKLVKNIKQEQALEEMNKNLRIIKEQNDEIIGDEFE